MAYIKYTWQNFPNVTTPISKANLDHLETQYDEVGNLFDAHSILIAIADNTPVVLPVAASTIVGRAAAGNIVALTGTQVRTLIGWTANKLLEGAGAGIVPTEIDAPGREFFVPPLFGVGATEGVTGDFYSWFMNGAGELVHFNFKVPYDFTALTHCKVLGIMGANGTIDWTATTEFAAIGEAYNTHSDTDTGNGLAMTASEIEEVDISLAFTGIVAGDFVGVQFTLDAISVGSYSVIGLVFKYT